MALFTRPQQAVAKVDGKGRYAVKMTFDLRSVWHATWVVIGALALLTAIGFVTGRAGSVVFSAVMAFFLAAAIEPAVSRFAKHMKRGLATALVVLLVTLVIAGFFAAFGSLLLDEVQALVEAAPGLVTDGVNLVNKRFHTESIRGSPASPWRRRTPPITVRSWPEASWGS